MALRPGLQARQTQRLSLTPGLRQSLAVLQMSAGELQAHIAAEVGENPLLVAESSPNSGSSSGGDAFQYAIDTTPQAQSMGERLRGQIALMAASPEARHIAVYLSGELTDEGYLDTTAGELAEFLGVPEALVESGIGLLQACEPTGIGARNLQQCLTLQLREKGESEANIATVFQHLELFAQANWKRLSRLTGLPEGELLRIAKVIRSLMPRPTDFYEIEDIHYDIPDIFVLEDPGDVVVVQLNSRTTPSLSVDLAYAGSVGADAQDTAAYLAERKERALQLIRAVDARGNTILRVATALATIQHKFFKDGPSHLVPLTLSTLAEALDLHVSTVSRALAGKSISSPVGDFRISELLTSSVKSLTDGESYSSFAVQQEIKTLIEHESAKNILSDQMIMDQLRESGVDIARRTVAKYRQCMKIPSSSQRRRSKRFL